MKNFITSGWLVALILITSALPVSADGSRDESDLVGLITQWVAPGRYEGGQPSLGFARCSVDVSVDADSLKMVVQDFLSPEDGGDEWAKILVFHYQPGATRVTRLEERDDGFLLYADNPKESISPIARKIHIALAVHRTQEGLLLTLKRNVGVFGLSTKVIDCQLN